ncbi:MAG: methyltransferase domain-containing protein [Leptolyngbya sp. PLA1]|nr:methyltransferase domain-containing protein [Leptolyngbya sp. PLA1]
MSEGIANAPSQPPTIEPKPAGDSAPDPADGANYAYWRSNGGSWADEYDARKLVQPYYHIQELLLCDYVQHHATPDRPLKVLEFGCGVGRHLRYLSRLPHVEVFGYDQSPTMVACCLRWTGQDWIDRHIRIGPPTGRLPFEDGSFDLVYTSEVLIHVRPEHLGGVLSELLRVSRGQVLHLEPGLLTEVSREAHHGCWGHDLAGAYQLLNHQAQTLPQGFRLQTPVRVVKSGQDAWTWSPVMLELSRRLEKDLESGLAREREKSSTNKHRAETLAKRVETLTAELAAVKQELESTRATAAGIRAERDRYLTDAKDKARSLAESAAVLDARTSEAKALARESEALRTALAQAKAALASLENSLTTQRAAHAAQITEAVARTQQEARDRLSHAAIHARELAGEAERWRQLAAQAEQERDEARAQTAQAIARAQHLAAERAEFIAEAERRLGVNPPRGTP